MALLFTMGVYGEIIYPLSDLNEILPESSSKTLRMIEVSLSLIERDVTKTSPKFGCAGQSVGLKSDKFVH